MAQYSLPGLLAFWGNRAAEVLDALNATPAGRAVQLLALLLLALAVLRAAAGVAAFVWAYFLRPPRDLRYYGAWAVVTGCTDGIGKAYAAQLAKRGLNLVLISRTESKLKDCAAELEAAHGIEARTVAVDLCKATPADYARVAAALEGLEVGVLVNNAGMGYDHPEYLDELSESFLTDIIAVNAAAPTTLAKLVMGGMRQRRRGVVVNLGSGVSTMLPSAPLLSVYAGTKAYVDTFSRSLDAEYAAFGVRVQNQSPLFVATKMSKIRRARLDVPSPDVWAAAAVRQIGRETSFTPYWFHGLQLAAVRLAPTSLIVGYAMRLHQGFRARFYAREARAAAAAASAGGAPAEPEETPKRELRRRK